MAYTLEIDDIELISNIEHKSKETKEAYTYYFRRGNTLFFRNALQKISIEDKALLTHFRSENIKYGHRVFLEY